MAAKLPWFKWFAADWLSDEKLRACSIAARGLWADMLSLMHKSDRRGYLLVGGKPATSQQLARMTGCSVGDVSRLLAELLDSGVPSVTDDGIIFSRRMVRDDSKSTKCSEAGAKGGGNPKFRRLDEWKRSPGFIYAFRDLDDGNTKIGASSDPGKRKKDKSGSLAHKRTETVRVWAVTQQGFAETALHELFQDKCVGGEWFKLSQEDIDGIEDYLTLKGHLKRPPKVQPNVRPNVASDSECLGVNGSTHTHTPEVGGVGEGGATFKGRAVESLSKDFDTFWKAYPLKDGKMEARIAWDELSPPPDLVQKILQAVERQKKSDKWRRRIIMNAANWLRANRWEDEGIDLNGDVPNETVEEMVARQRKALSELGRRPG